MSTDVLDPSKIDLESIEQYSESHAHGEKRGGGTSEAEESKQLTLHFSNSGASLKFETQSEIDRSLEFVKFGEPMPGSVSMPIEPEPPKPIFKSPGLLTSKTYFHILNDPVMDKQIEEYDALSNEEKRLHDLILDKKIRKGYRRKTAPHRDINLRFALESNDIKNYEFQSYLEQVTKELELKGLWREELTESVESSIFMIDDVRDDDLDENFDPKELHVIYNLKNMSSQKDSLQELKEEGLEWQDEISISPSDLPEFTTPTIHNLIRRAPWSLHETIARKLVDGAFFSNHPELEDLFPCAYFVSKSIFDRALFIQVKYQAFAGTAFQKKFRTYSYRKFQSDQKTLLKITNEVLKKYFHQNPFVRENAEKIFIENKSVKTTAESMLKSIWRRYFEVDRRLTKKQKNALSLIYTDDPKLTYEEAALAEGISKDSFQDRVRGAVKKIKQALPELDNLIEPKTYFKSKEQNLLYNGLFCKDSAKEVHRLFRVDPETKKRTEILTRLGPPKMNRQGPSKEAVRAWSITSTLVPDFIFTDFYLGLVPEADIRRKSGRPKFRG